MSNMFLTVATPDRPVLKREEVNFVDIPTVNGYVGILPGHTSLISLLDTGLLSYGKNRNTASVLAVESGFLEVSDNEITVIADALFFADDVVKSDMEKLLTISEEIIVSESNPDKIARALSDKKKALCLLELANNRT